MIKFQDMRCSTVQYMHIIGEVESSAWSTVSTVLGWPTQCRILNKKSCAKSLPTSKACPVFEESCLDHYHAVCFGR